MTDTHFCVKRKQRMCLNLKGMGIMGKTVGKSVFLQWLQIRRVGQTRFHLPLTDYHLWAVFTHFFLYLIFLGSINLYKLMCSQIHRFWNAPILSLLIWTLILASEYAMYHYPPYKMNYKAYIPGLLKNEIVWGRKEHSMIFASWWTCGRFLYYAFTIICWNAI